MKRLFYSFSVVFLTILPLAGLFAQQNVSAPRKYALVIGNAAYAGSARLKNPVNDATDMAAALQQLGFTVDKVTDGSLDDMEKAIELLKNRLSASKNTYGFFFYAGHGVQSNGVNYLIPVGANIVNENSLRERAVSVQWALAELNEAGNDLNVIVLDACRDNPFEWARGRGGGRGLTMVSNQPAESILVYATSAGSTAADGEGRNGLFTSQLLKNLKTPGLEVSEVFRLTGADVSQVSERRQIPAVYNQFFGRAYLGIKPAETIPPQPVETAIAQPVPMPQPAPFRPLPPDGSGEKPDSDNAAKLWSLGASLGTSFAAPWIIGTFHGTVAPFSNSFFELGIDFGMVSGIADVEQYYSLYPFIHAVYFQPFTESGGWFAGGSGWFAGGGGGYMIGNYTFSKEDIPDIPVNIFALDIIAGVNIGNMLDVSYTLRTNFKSANHKLAVGYTHRFK